MSKGQLPAYVDTRRAFLQEMRLGGQVSLDRLPRFRENLINDQASIVVNLAFGLGDQGQRQISGVLSARAELTCQRCLQAVEAIFEDSIRLVLLNSDSDAAALQPDWEPWLGSQDYKLQLAEIVDEQLILALPIVSTHADHECIRALGYEAPVADDKSAIPAATSDDNPFAVLATLKGRTDDEGQG